MINVRHLSASTSEGGAARGAMRIHDALLQFGFRGGIQSSFQAMRGTTTSQRCILGPPHNQFSFWPAFRKNLMRLKRYRWRTNSSIFHSIAWPDTGLGRQLNNNYSKSHFNILNLHWLGDDTISIEEIGRLKCPVIWTLHDQWPFCGAEHYVSDTIQLSSDSMSNLMHRYSLSYRQSSCPKDERKNDLNRKTWLRKFHAWKCKMLLVCPSQWMLDCVSSSSLFAEWPKSVIPVPIDHEEWKPCGQLLSRDALELPRDKSLILFGALDLLDPRKGADLLIKALKILSNKSPELADSAELVVFGGANEKNPINVGFKVHYLGRLFDNVSLRMAYSACDVMVVPSRQEAFGQTASEASACGLPVVAFAATGLLDVVQDFKTGRLANPFDPLSLAQSIEWVLEDNNRRSLLSESARQRAVSLWCYSRVSELYSDVYKACYSSHLASS